jgi:thiamine thiazole synthase
MMISERDIALNIIKEAAKEWEEILKCDVVIVGAGPSGLTAGKYLAERKLNVVVFERRLSFGGGIGGGGMLFHKIIIEEPAVQILDDFEIKYKRVGGNLSVVDSSELMAKLATKCIDSGAKIIHGVTVDDVIFRENPLRITGVCIQWSAVEMSGLHVDPLFVESEAVIDATGHDAEVLSVATRKVPINFTVFGERSAYAEEAEKLIVEKTDRIVKGLYVAGMAVAAAYNLPRMGPIFGGMLMSGKKVAEIVAEDLKSLDEPPR